MDIIDRLEIERRKDQDYLPWNSILLNPRADFDVKATTEIGLRTEYDARLVLGVLFVANSAEYGLALARAREQLCRALYADFHAKTLEVIGMIYAHERDGALHAAEELLSLINQSCRRG